MLYRAGEPIEVLTYDKLKTLIRTGQVDIPRITERSINDKSKGDYLSKCLVVVQTTWFIVQCGARWALGLPLAELEVVTLAFAVLNAITYALWLNKPQNVQEAIGIELRLDSHDYDSDSKSEVSDTESWSTALSKIPSPSGHPPSKTRPQRRTAQARSWLLRHLVKDYNHSRSSWQGLFWFMAYRVPYRIVTSALHPMKKLYLHLDSQDSNSNPLRVSMFSKERLDNIDPVLVHYLPCLIGTLFGSVHIMAWSSGPSKFERGLWRYSTLIITVEPLLFAIAKGVTSWKTKLDTGYCFLDFIRGILICAISFPFIVGLPAYVIARVILFTQALASLRHLPLAAYCSVDWTSFAPHL